MLADLALALTLGVAAPPASLDAARDDEIATLRREREALRAEVEGVEAGAKSATRALTEEIEGLAAELERVQADNAARERRLPATERARDAEVQRRHLDELLAQMRTWLTARGVATGEVASGPDELPRLVELATIELERTGGLRVEPDATWFGSDGVPRHGDVLHVGEVAALTWNAAAVPLLRTPEGLQQVAELAPQRERVAAGERVRVVLHDPDTRADPRAWVASSWTQTMDRGGPLMWVLFAIGCVALLVAIERTLVLGWLALRWRAVVRRVEGWAALEPTARRERVAAERGWLSLPLVIVAQQSFEGAQLDRAAIEERATQAVIAVRERLFRRLSLLSLAAGVAPLAGLLGTVNGMITTFSVVTTRGTSDAQLLAGGISEALLTTQFGLVIAIPALIGHAMLSRGARRVLVAVEQTVLRHIHGLALPEHDSPHDHDDHLHSGGRLAAVSDDD